MLGAESTRPPKVSVGCGGKTAHPVPPCTHSPSSSGIALPSSPTIPHHIGRVGCKGFLVNLSTSKSLGIDQARISSSGFPFYVPPQHLHPGLLPSQVHTQGHLQLPFTRHRYSISKCPGSTTWQDSPQARRYSSSVDTTLTLHAPKTHAARSHTTKSGTHSQTIPRGFTTSITSPI